MWYLFRLFTKNVFRDQKFCRSFAFYNIQWPRVANVKEMWNLVNYKKMIFLLFDMFSRYYAIFSVGNPQAFSRCITYLLQAPTISPLTHRSMEISSVIFIIRYCDIQPFCMDFKLLFWSAKGILNSGSYSFIYIVNTSNKCFYELVDSLNRLIWPSCVLIIGCVLKTSGTAHRTGHFLK